MPAGRLDVTVLSGKDLKNTQTFGRQDPFFVVRVGNKHFTSEVAQDAGKNPVWNARFSFDITNEDRIFFTIRNRNVLTSDSLLGEAEINLVKVFAEGKDDAMAQVVTGSGKIHGTLSVILLFTSFGGKGSGQPKANKQQQAQQMGGYPPQPLGGMQPPVQYQQPPPQMQGYSQSPPPSAPPMPHGGVFQAPRDAPAGFGTPPGGYPRTQPTYPQQPGSQPGAYPQQPGSQPGAYPARPGYPQQHGSPPPAGYSPHSSPRPAGYPPVQGGYPLQQGYPPGPYPPQGGLPPSGYPQQPGYQPGYGGGGYYGGGVAAPTGMYYTSHHAGKHKHGKKSKKGKKKWF